MNKKCILLLCLAIAMVASAETKTLRVEVSNPLNVEVKDVPVAVKLNEEIRVKSEELEYQLDDLDGDGLYDELCFLTDLAPLETKVFTIKVGENEDSLSTNNRVYAEMLLTNKKIKSENKQDLYISSLTVDGNTNPYWQLHHHGPAFENDMVAYRIYFDNRQTVDIYGKYHRGLELRETQFYPDSLQKAMGYGDDVLWVGKTFGVGTLRGWDGESPQMVEPVEKRTLSIVASGPLRTVVKVENKGWNGIDVTTLYILYSGHRDCEVRVKLNEEIRVNAAIERGQSNSFELSSVSGVDEVKKLEIGSRLFSTGLINVKGSEEYSDGEGLRGCWGTDWPVSAKDSVGHKRETVGLGICLPREVIVNELPADKNNYPYVIGNIGCEGSFTYHIAFASANEEFESEGAPEGFRSAKQWFEWLQLWKKRLFEIKINVKREK